MKKAFLYPYTQQADSIIKLHNHFKGFELDSVGCFPEDKRYLTQRYPYIKITNTYDEGINHADILLANEEIPEHMQPALANCIAYAEKQRKEKYVYQDNFNEIDELGYEMKTPEVPVLVVLGQGEQCSKFETAVIICDIIRENGFDVLGISANPFSEIVGMKRIPKYFLSKFACLSSKVINFNRYVNDLCKAQNPDIIVIDIPGGIFPLSDSEHFHFGEMALIVSEALSVDSGVFNFYYNIGKMATKELVDFTNSVSQHCLSKYNFPIDFFCVSSQYIKPDIETKKADYLYLDQKFVSQDIKELNENIIYLGKNDLEIRNKLNSILERMQQNVEIV